MTKGSTVRVLEPQGTHKVRNTGAWGWLPAVTQDPPTTREEWTPAGHITWAGT